MYSPLLESDLAFDLLEPLLKLSESPLPLSMSDLVAASRVCLLR